MAHLDDAAIWEPCTHTCTCVIFPVYGLVLFLILMIVSESAIDLCEGGRLLDKK